jgi:guanylate kinase
MQGEDAFLEWAEVYGNLYGTPRSEVDRLLEEGYDVLLDIDTNGAMQVRSRCPQAVLVFVVAPSMEELKRRLRGRGTESTASLKRRLAEARLHMALIGHYDYVVVNDGLDEAFQRLSAIITAERCRVSRQDPESLMRLSR